MRAIACSTLISAIFCCTQLAGVIEAETRSPEDRTPAALAEGRNAVVVGTTGPLAVRAGVEALKKGGSAADAALTTALAQVVECGGSYVSHAGILSLVYYEAETGKVHYLNAGFNTPREEKDALSIPGGGKPSGRTALVPGFMAGVQAAHDRFGKLPRQEVFAPAIAIAKQGFKVSPLLARFLQARKAVLSRLPATRRIFTKEGDTFYAEGEHFLQPELANSLAQVADRRGILHVHRRVGRPVRSGRPKRGRKDHSGRHEIVSRHLGGASPDDVFEAIESACQALHRRAGSRWSRPCILLERAELPKQGHYATTPASLFWLMQISHCQVLGFLPADTLKNFGGLDLTPPSRVRKRNRRRHLAADARREMDFLCEMPRR